MTSDRPRSRVVMVVDNRVTVDSRVQKQAVSMAERGWEVVLLGLSPTREGDEYALGDATVRRIPLRPRLTVPLYRHRRAPLRSPLAYRPGPHADFRRQQVEAVAADLAERRARLRLGHGVERRSERARIGVRGVVLPVERAWVATRARLTERVSEARAAQTSRVDRAAAWWWSTLLGTRAWRRLDPHLWDFVLGFEREIIALEPDLVHANDVRALAPASRAVQRLRGRGRDTRLVWDAHEYTAGVDTGSLTPRHRAARVASEHEHAHVADGVVTVSDTLGRWLTRDFALATEPVTVLNAPVVGAAAPELGTVRAVCGLDADTPLLVYAGGLLERRGVATMVEALPELAGAHVALLCPDLGWAGLDRYRDLAARLGVSDRLHLLPYVPYDQVSTFLSDADVGVVPIDRTLNHDVALITKFLEYSHARLPIVVSDVEEMSRTVRETGQGEVFTARDTADYVRAVRRVLADPAAYRRSYDREGLLEGWTWERQADRLDAVYRRVLGRPQVPGERS